MKTIDIKNEDVPRLLIDLLIKNTCEIQSLKELIILQTSAASPLENRDKVLKGLTTGSIDRVSALREILKEEIYKQYGHIDLEGL